MNAEALEPDSARARLLALARDKRYSLRELSRLLERNPSYLHHFVHKGSPRDLPERERLKLASVLGVPDNTLRDSDADGLVHPPAISESSRPAAPPRRSQTPINHTPADQAPTLRQLPLLSARGENGAMVRIEHRHASEYAEIAALDADRAYAIRILDPSLAPKFDIGDIAYIDPDALAGPGDYVALTLTDARIVIGRLIERNAERLELRRPGTSELANIPAADVRAVEKIVAAAFR